MSAVKTNDDLSVSPPKSYSGKLPVVIALICFALTVVTYFARFHGVWNADQSVWGQFGDFVGGVINPLIGLCTIWLLIGSLKQSHHALLQAHADLETTRKILDETQKTQKSTEASLRRQIEIAEQAKDISSAMELLKYYNGLIEANSAKLEKLQDDMYSGGGRSDSLREENRSIYKKIDSLTDIIDTERERLTRNYYVKNC